MVSFDRSTFEDLRRRSSGDLTCLQTLLAQLSLVALRIVERYLDEWERRDRHLRQMLKKDVDLNDRQRAILGRALRKPEAEFTIRYHKTNHGIAYPTARGDFLQLVEKGYLDVHLRGKVLVFTASRRLQEVFADGPSLARLSGFTVDMRAPEQRSGSL
jgi:Fic family protein